MKKVSLALLSLLFIFNSTKAQLAQKGSSYLQIGYGFPSAMQFMGQIFKLGASIETDDVTATSTFKYKGFGPLHFRYEYMLGGRVGMGLSANAEFGNFKFVNSYTDIDDNYVTSTTDFNFSSINGLVRTNFHFLKNSEKADLYYGLGLGYSYTRVKLKETLEGEIPDPEDQEYINEFNDYLNSIFKFFPVAVESVFGGRFALGQNAGIYFEVGYSKAFAQLGFFAKLGNQKGYNRSRWQWY
jgi:hypothetical protein